MNFFYLPLESYKERYTETLAAITVKRLLARKKDTTALHIIQPTAETTTIDKGSVLDVYKRPRYALRQMAQLLTHLEQMEAELSWKDVIYIEDMFHPGWESLPYLFEQIDYDNTPRIYTRNFAQSVDPDDFTFPMRHWMRYYEKMVMQTVDGVFVASTVHKEMMEAACLDANSIYVTGLAVDRESTLAQGVTPLPWVERKKRVIYTSRFDKEKQPEFLLEIARHVRDRMGRKDIEFHIAAGSDEIRSNDPSVPPMLAAALKDGTLTDAHLGLSKAAYYALLGASRCQLNTARQDFVSYTAIDASCYETPTLAPAFRSFPEALFNDPRFLYIPWSAEDAAQKVVALVDSEDTPEGVDRLWRRQDQSFDKMFDIMLTEE